MNDANTRRLIVSMPDESEVLVRLGTLAFDAANRATLATEGSGPAVEELQQAWQEISQESELIWKQTRPQVIDGHEVTQILGVPSKPGDANYIYAVMNTLERKFGYLVDLETPE
jgi:hypothetical protein